MPVLHPTFRRLAALQASRALLVWALALTVIPGWPARAEEQRVALGDRFYLIDLPANAANAPILLALHGGGGDPAQFAASSGLGRAGAEKGYAVIFPAGSSRRGNDRLLTWNGGYCCGYAARAGIDDDAFLKAVIKDATARFDLNSGPVFITGMSNGSIMAETFAARNPELVAAVAGVAGTMDTKGQRVTGPVPALVVHGTADSMVPYAGGKGVDSLTRTEFSSVDQVVQAFLDAQPGTLTQTRRAIDRKDDGTSVEMTDWSKGLQAVVRLITVKGGAHHWPGGRKARLDTGKTQEIDANTEILRFFSQFR